MNQSTVPAKRRPRQRLRENLAFFTGFLREPAIVGSVIPSSRFLERSIVDACAMTQGCVVVELGPGTGGTTQALLAAMPDDARLLAIELDPGFTRMMREQIDDPRLIVHEGSATDIAEILAQHGLPAPDIVVSGIPFSTMPDAVGESIIARVWQKLAPGGRFIAYQFRDRVAVLGQRQIGAPTRRLTLLNIPPMRVFTWRKPPAA